MKRIFCICLCVFALTGAALAVDDDNFTYWYDGQLLTGRPAHLASVLAVMEASPPDDNDFGLWEAKKSAVRKELEAALAESEFEPEPEPLPEPESDAAPEPEPIPEPEPEKQSEESAGISHETVFVPPVDTDTDDKYPIGAYIDPAGNVWSASGELLSPGTTPAMEPAESDAPVAAQVLPETGAPVYTVADLRGSDVPSGDSLTGLKGLIVSIFGEYTPVTTTAAVTETVNGETTTTLVNVVADGAAGVDYEWIAGVLLFAILLFCMMKLLGGVVK